MIFSSRKVSTTSSKPYTSDIKSLVLSPRTKKAPKALSFVLAEGEGFEPSVPYGTLVFKTSAIDLSAIPPVFSIGYV